VLKENLPFLFFYLIWKGKCNFFYISMEESYSFEVVFAFTFDLASSCGIRKHLEILAIAK